MKKRLAAIQRSARGYSLVELMIAMALGLVILLVVSEIFIKNSATRNEIEKSGRQIENGRFAIQLLTDEIANAGFAGEGGAAAFPLVPPSGVNDACATPANAAAVIDALGAPVYGGNSQPSCAGNYKAGGSFIALRRVSTCAVGEPGCDAFAENHHHVQVAACETSSVIPSGERVIGTTAGAMTAKSRDCTTNVPIYRFLSRLYYIDGADNLVRAELVGSAYQVSPLVEGIEKLEFEYGVDTNPLTGTPDTFMRAADMVGSDWENVLAVRVWLVARNLDPTPGYTDLNKYSLAGQEYVVGTRTNHKRQVFSGVAPINNLLGRN